MPPIPTTAHAGLKLRTITYFVPQQCTTLDEWIAELQRAAQFLFRAQAFFQAQGYEVQTLRVATRVLEVATDPVGTAAALERAATRLGIGFLNAGATSSLAQLADGTIGRLAQSSQFTSCSFAWQQGMGHGEALQLARLIFKIAEDTDGAGNFRFGVSFNCPPGIPYFPAAHPGPEAGFAIGTENSALLFEGLDRAARSGGGLGAVQPEVQAMLAAVLLPVEQLALQLEQESGQHYLGLDASIAPALERPNIAEAYERLCLGRLGRPGTLAVTERVTAALKALPLQRRTGYSGVMLPVAEDTGLAEAAAEGRLSVQGLLHLSSVCGCGLDTVPVPGVGPGTSAEERQALEQSAAALLLDVAALAFRLNKPLSCRLLPVPGARAGDATRFTSPYLVNCRVMEL